MANRTVIRMFRCTQEEADKIKIMAAENHLSESAFIRRKIFWQSPETDELLKSLEHYDLKIGTNINQIVRSCNSKKFITKEDYKELVRLLEKLDDHRYEVIRQIKENGEKLFSAALRENSEIEKNEISEGGGADASDVENTKLDSLDDKFDSVELDDSS